MNDTFDFVVAINLLREGKVLARRGWNGRGLSVRLQVPDAGSKMTKPYFYITAHDEGEDPSLDTRVPWLPSQTDLLGEDWYEVV